MRHPKSLLLAVAVAVGIVACSSSEPLAVEFSHPHGHGAALPFQAAGAAVDEGVVCSTGSMEVVRLESMDGEEITDEEWAVIFDTAMASGSIAEMILVMEWTCDNESDGFTMEFHNQFDMATFEFEGPQQVGTWEISAGTGSLSDLSGSGDVVSDFDSFEAIYTGEAQS